MSTKFQTFKALHSEFFVLPNAWNAKSALLFEQNNFPAVATSSAAVAESMGYKDGEGMPFNDYLFVISRILSAVQVPVSVDVEMGYGRSDEEIQANIVRLAKMGVAGINIEDSNIGESGRVLKGTRQFVKTLDGIRKKLLLERLELFINVRCDTFVLNVNNKLEETKARLHLYEAAGADGIFLPCIANENDIERMVGHTKLPLNVMCIPGLPDLDTLKKLGVKRASLGPFLFNKGYDGVSRLSRSIIADNSFSPII